MSITRRGILLVLAVALCAAPVADAQPRDRGPTIKPADRVAGVTGGQLLAESWATILSTPEADNPFLGNGGAAAACLRLGPEEEILSPAIAGVPRPTECTVEAGTLVFIIGYTTECSSVENPRTSAKRLSSGAPSKLTGRSRRSCSLSTAARP